MVYSKSLCRFSLSLWKVCKTMYHNLLKICPWAKNLSGSSKRGASVFLRIVIKKPTSHAVSLALFMSACSDSEIPLVMHLLMKKQISFINFVSPSCTVSLVHLAKPWCTAA